MANTLVAPIRIWSTLGDYGTYGKKLTTAVDNWAIFANVYWFGFPTASGRISQTIFYNGHSGTDGWGLIVAGDDDTGGGGIVNRVSILAGGVQWASGGVQLIPGALNSIIASREGGSMLLRVNGSASALNHNPTPNSPSNDAYAGGDGQNLSFNVQFNGVILSLGVWARSGAAPLDSTDKTNLETIGNPVGIGTAYQLAAHVMRGAPAGSELDYSGNSNTLTITGTTVVPTGVPASRRYEQTNRIPIF